MTKERLTGLNPRNEREAFANQIPKDKQEYVDHDLAIAESIVTALRAFGYEAKISELAQNLQDQYYSGNVLLGEQFRQLRRQAPFQWDKFGAVNLVVLVATTESIYSQHFEEVEPRLYPDWSSIKTDASWEEKNTAWEKRNQEIRNWWLNRKIRILDVREFKQHFRDLAELRWEEDQKSNQELQRIIFAGWGRRIRYIYVDWRETSPEAIKRKRFNELHPRDEKGRFVKK